VVRGRRQHHVFADGEPATHTPAEFTVVPRAIPSMCQKREGETLVVADLLRTERRRHRVDRLASGFAGVIIALDNRSTRTASFLWASVTRGGSSMRATEASPS